eukprot:1194195-Prorocentrum_minimum.AAC.1
MRRQTTLSPPSSEDGSRREDRSVSPSSSEDGHEFAKWSGSQNDVYSTKPPDGFSQLEDAALSLDQLQEAFRKASAHQVTTHFNALRPKARAMRPPNPPKTPTP